MGQYLAKFIMRTVCLLIANTLTLYQLLPLLMYLALVALEHYQNLQLIRRLDQTMFGETATAVDQMDYMDGGYKTHYSNS